MLKLKIFPFCLLALGLLLSGACAKKISIAEIKAKGFIPKNNNPFGPDYKVKGYLLLDPVPYLVSDSYWVGINRPVPDSAYLLLTSKHIFSKVYDYQVKEGTNKRDPEKYEGRFVCVRGNITSVPTPNDTLDEIALETNGVNGATTTDAPCCTTKRPQVLPLCSLNPDICTLPTTIDPRKFALLYSGGIDSNRAAKRYWNDLVFMYHVLHNKYGFPTQNIIVVYQDSIDESCPDCQMPVNFPATQAGVTAAFDQLDSDIRNPTVQDSILLFVFTTNHGSQDVAVSATLEGDPSDELLCWYNQSGTQLLDQAFDAFLDQIDPDVTIVGLYEQCNSGGFLKDCIGPNRINIAAASSTGDSYALRPSPPLPCMRYDAFSYYFTVALYGKYHNGTALPDDPDRDGDHKVSILEAYWYAAARDIACSADETPPAHFLGDNNGATPNGSDVPMPANPAAKPASTANGYKASNTYLK